MAFDAEWAVILTYPLRVWGVKRCVLFFFRYDHKRSSFVNKVVNDEPIGRNIGEFWFRVEDRQLHSFEETRPNVCPAAGTKVTKEYEILDKIHLKGEIRILKPSFAENIKKSLNYKRLTFLTVVKAVWVIR